MLPNSGVWLQQHIQLHSRCDVKWYSSRLQQLLNIWFMINLNLYTEKLDKKGCLVTLTHNNYILLP